MFIFLQVFLAFRVKELKMEYNKLYYPISSQMQITLKPGNTKEFSSMADSMAE